MPDVKDAEKTQIKSRARRYAQDLLDAPLSKGLGIYSSTYDKLYERSSRWKICLKCGTIDKKDNLNETNHHCASGIQKLPVIIPTNWVILKEFFLSDEYVKALQALGVEPIAARPSLVTVPVEEEVEVAVKATTKASVKAGKDVPDT